MDYSGLGQRGEMRGDNVGLSGVCSVSSEVGGGGERGGTQGVEGRGTKWGWEPMNNYLTMTTGTTKRLISDGDFL